MASPAKRDKASLAQHSTSHGSQLQSPVSPSAREKYDPAPVPRQSRVLRGRAELGTPPNPVPLKARAPRDWPRGARRAPPHPCGGSDGRWRHCVGRTTERPPPPRAVQRSGEEPSPQPHCSKSSVSRARSSTVAPEILRGNSGSKWAKYSITLFTSVPTLTSLLRTPWARSDTSSTSTRACRCCRSRLNRCRSWFRSPHSSTPRTRDRGETFRP